MLFPDLDDLGDLEDSTTRDSTTSPLQREEQISTTPTQRLEKQAQLVCETLKALTIALYVMVIFVFGGTWLVQWLLVR